MPETNKMELRGNGQVSLVGKLNLPRGYVEIEAVLDLTVEDAQPNVTIAPTYTEEKWTEAGILRWVSEPAVLDVVTITLRGRISDSDKEWLTMMSTEAADGQG